MLTYEAHREGNLLFDFTQVHGEGLVVQQGAAAGAGFASTLVELTIQPEAGCIIHMPPVKKKLPHTMLIKDLKLFCHAVFGKKLPVADMKLCFIDPDMPIGSVFDLSDEYRELGPSHYLSIKTKIEALRLRTHGIDR